MNRIFEIPLFFAPLWVFLAMRGFTTGLFGADQDFLVVTEMSVMPLLFSGENNAVIVLDQMETFNLFIFMFSVLVLFVIFLAWRKENKQGKEKFDRLNHQNMIRHRWLLNRLQNPIDKMEQLPLPLKPDVEPQNLPPDKWSSLIFTTFKSKFANCINPKIMIKISLVDDHKLFRSGINALLSSNDTYQVVSESDNGKAFIDSVEEVQPEIVLMDLEMPEMDGMETTKALKEKFPDVKVIMLSMHDDEKFIAHMMSIGARGYLLKNADPEEIELAINSVAETGYFFSDLVSRATLQGLTSGGNVKPTFKPGNDLTEREREVLQLICQEKTAAEIGEILFISPRTVEGHRNNIILKTGARNTAGIVVFAMKNGLFEL